MARFPLAQSDVLQFAEAIVAGLTASPAVYPSPPVAAADLAAQLAACRAAVDQVVAARAAYEQAVTAKDASLASLAAKMRKDLRYAENTVDFDDDKLKLLGWAAKRSAKTQRPPGQPLALKSVDEGPGTLLIEWKHPARNSGGPVRTYIIESRELSPDEGATWTQWRNTETSLETKAALKDQPRATQLEYRIKAINKAGQSPPSNTIAVVL